MAGFRLIRVCLIRGALRPAVPRCSLRSWRRIKTNWTTYLRQLHDALAAVTAGQDKLAADQAALTAYEQKTREELTAQAAKLREGQVELANAKDAREDNLAEREKRIGELEHRWAFIGDDDDVRRGFRAREFSALFKARSAYGYASDATAGLR
jgi:predicted nuclease with TOPRIM domain